MAKPKRPKTMTIEPDDTLLSTAEAAAILGIATKTLSNWRGAGKGPPYVNVDRPRYPRSALCRWLSNRPINNGRPMLG